MKVAVVVFEDRGWRGLYPATLSRPAFDCRVGVTTLARRLGAQLQRLDHKRVELLCRPVLRPLVERNYPGHAVNHDADDPGDVVFLNGRLLCLGDALGGILNMLSGTGAVTWEDEPVAVRLSGAAAAAYANELRSALDEDRLPSVPRGQTPAAAPEGAMLARRLWDLVGWNAEVLEDDFQMIPQPRSQRHPETTPGAQIIHRERILCRDGVQIEPGAILDATGGPIFLGEGSRVLHNAVILGPAHIGPHSIVNMGARLEGSVSVGPVCKVGGEVEGSILQGHTNKQHDGFLGHSYLGEWINLGAATNVSDLKNNYSTVRVWSPEGTVDTGRQFVGVFMGDHTKTAIGTVLNTGTVIGFSCNVFGPGFPPKHVPSFTWGHVKTAGPYKIEEALGAARAAMSRRQIEMEPADEVLFRTLHAEAVQGTED